MINVTQSPYNADNTGATDATTAINSALDAAAAAPGNSVYFPAGTYKLSGTLTIPSNVEVYGDGAASLLQVDKTLSTGFNVLQNGVNPASLSITAATNASPIVITTSTPHLYSSGQSVNISGVVGNTNANGNWVVTRLTATTFSLNGSTGSGAYTSGGAVVTALPISNVTYPNGPFVITTPVAHGYTTGQTVIIASVGGTTGANGTWVITVQSSTTFSLNGSVGSGTYTSNTGNATPVAMNISIHDLHINGGGQTTDVGHGVKASIGIVTEGITGVWIDNVIVDKMGIANTSTPTSDSGYGGYGIYVSDSSLVLNNVRISRCTVTNVAGGGYSTGDGISVEASTGSIMCRDIVVSDCRVSVVGRHCYAAANGQSGDLPNDVRFIGCYGEKAALSGVDIEDANNTLIEGCVFYQCGNDQTYYNPTAAGNYGSDYRLCAGVATSNNSSKVTVSNSHFDGCYYGLTNAATDGLSVTSCRFENSTQSDCYTPASVAASAANFRITGSEFRSSGSTENLLRYYNTGVQSGFVAQGCVFYREVDVQAMYDGAFIGCTFKRGLYFIGGGDKTRITVSACTFDDYAGAGIDASVANSECTDVLVTGCQFQGAGNMTYGISMAYYSAIRWLITGNIFTACTTAAIHHANAAAIKAFSAVNNSIIGTIGGAGGITINEGMTDCIVSGNAFSSVSGWCISFTGIDATQDLQRMVITNNVAASDCTNGLEITVTTGTYNYCLIDGNNVQGCTGTTLSLPNPGAGNVVTTMLT